MSANLLTPRVIVGFYCAGTIVCRSCAVGEQNIGAVIRRIDAGAKNLCSKCGNSLAGKVGA